MPSGILAELTPKFLLNVVEEFPRNREYLATTFFPQKDIGSFEVMWNIMKANNRMAGIYGVDAETVPGDGIRIQRLAMEAVVMRASFDIRESQISVLGDTSFAAIMNTSRNAQTLLNDANTKISEDLQRAAKQVETVKEYLAMSALQGSITWPVPNIRETKLGQTYFSMDYRFNPLWNGISVTQIEGGTGVVWSTLASADITRDLVQMMKMYETHLGVTANNIHMLMDRTTLTNMARNAAMITIVQNTSSRPVQATDIKDFVLQEFGITIHMYTAQYSTLVPGAVGDEPSEQWYRFLPEGRIIVMPDFAWNDGNVGQFISAPAMSNNWKSGPYTWRQDYENPWKIQVGVGFNGFPKIDHPEAIMVWDTI